MDKLFISELNAYDGVNVYMDIWNLREYILENRPSFV